jgi:beta-lactamase class A
MFSLLVLAAAADPAPLETKLRPAIAAHRGTIAVAVKHLGTGEEFKHNADAVLPTASLCKVMIMAEAYRQADAEKLDLTKMLTLAKTDKVPGAGVLTDHFSDGVQLPLRDCVRLMIVFSDNTATNMVLDAVGINRVNDFAAKLGLPESRVNSKVYKRTESSVNLNRSEKYGLGSTTANETVKLFGLLHAGKVVNAKADAEMLGHLKANDDKEMLVRFLPAGAVVAHKTGAVTLVRTDAGILFVPTPGNAKTLQAVAVAVLTAENEDKRWVLENAAQVTIATIGKTVYEHYAGK